jgi:hypothetical protein
MGVRPVQLSIDLHDTLKNRPPTAATEKNDVALVRMIEGAADGALAGLLPA